MQGDIPGGDKPSPAEKKDWMKKLEKITGRPLEEPDGGGRLKEPEEPGESIHRPELSGQAGIQGYVYILLDTSGSMNTRNKISQARRGTISFIHKAYKRKYRTGIIEFSSRAKIIVKPAASLKKLESGVKRIEAAGSTNLTAALKLARQELENIKGNRVVYIVTDGKPDDKKSSLEAAEYLKKSRGVTIITLGTDDADEGFLDKLSSGAGLNKMTSGEALETGISSMVSLLPVEDD